MELGCESAQDGTRLTAVSLVLRQISSAGRCLLIEFELPPGYFKGIYGLGFSMLRSLPILNKKKSLN